MFLTFTLISTGRIQFSFFPNFSSDQVLVELEFDSKASFDEKRQYLNKLESAMYAINQQYPESIIEHAHVVNNLKLTEEIRANPSQNGIHIWLTNQNTRITNQQFIDDLRARALNQT